MSDGIKKKKTDSRNKAKKNFTFLKAQTADAPVWREEKKIMPRRVVASENNFSFSPVC